MQVFKTFFRITKKQLPSCLIYLGIFVCIAAVLTAQGSEQRGDYTNYRAKIAIFDRDNSTASKKLAEYLGGLNDIVDVEDDEELLLDSLYYQDLDYILYIEAGYETSGALTNVKRPGSNTGIYVDNEIASYQKSVDALIGAGYSMDEAHAVTLDALNDEGLVSIKGKNTEKPGIYYYYVYIPYIITMTLFNSLAPVLIAFNKKEISDRTNVSPISHRSKSTQLALGSVILSVALLLVFIVMSVILYGGDCFTENGLYYMLNSFIYMVLTVGIVSIVGNFNLKPEAISAISNIVGLGFSFLGGIFVPMEIFGKGLLAVSRFMPTYWYVKAQDSILAGNLGNELFQYFGVELLFALAFLAVAMVISKHMKLKRTA